jgi:hypothetical protein
MIGFREVEELARREARGGGRGVGVLERREGREKE